MVMLRDDNATQDVNEVASPPAETQTPAPAEKPNVGEARKVQGEEPRIVEEVVIEEVSIDGMCGVY